MRSACVEWEKILAEYPNDLMALKFAHDAYFFAGDNQGESMRIPANEIYQRQKRQCGTCHRQMGQAAAMLQVFGKIMNR